MTQRSTTGLNVVALNGASFVTDATNRASPGEGWQLIASQGNAANRACAAPKGDQGRRDRAFYFGGGVMIVTIGRLVGTARPLPIVRKGHANADHRDA
jgi:hypothetical protein